MMRRALRSGLVALAAGLALTGIVQAHALLVRSVPESNAELAQAPATVEMWFSEPLEPGFSRARLINASGEEVPTGAGTIDPFDPTHMSLPVGQLGPGIYTVAWQTLSKVDGHEWYGSFPFTVLNPDGSRPGGAPATITEGGRGELPAPGEAASRWLALLGSILLFGVPLFQRVVVRASPPPGPEHDAPLTKMAHDLALRALWVAVLAISAGNGLQIVLQALRLGGVDQLPDLLLGTRTGALLLARQSLAFTALAMILPHPQPAWVRGHERLVHLLTLVCAAGMMFLLVLASGRGERALALTTIALAAAGMGLTSWGPDPPEAFARRTWEALLLVAGGLLLSFSVGSHAGAVPGSVWAVLADYAHLVAAAAWIGGLLLLPFLVWQIRRAGLSAEQADFLPLVERFSYLAALAVYVLAVTGLFNSLVELPTLSSLFDTSYGRVLLVKLVLIVIALQIAFLNNRLVHRNARRLAQAAGLRRFNRQVAQEAVVGLVIMLSVAVLVQTPAPRSLAPTTLGFDAPFSAIHRADDLSIHLQVTPNRAGDNRFWAHLYHEDGSPIGEVQLVRLIFNYREAQLGQAQTDLESLGQDTFALEGAFLNQAGEWDVSVYVRRRGLDDTLTDFSLDVSPASDEFATSASPWQNPIPTLPTPLIVAGALVTLGVIPLVWRRPLRVIWARLYPAAAVIGGLLIAMGLGVALWVLTR